MAVDNLKFIQYGLLQFVLSCLGTYNQATKFIAYSIIGKFFEKLFVSYS